MKRDIRSILLSLLFSPVLLLFVFGRSADAQTLTADQIIEKHLTAMGGREALSKLTTRRATGTIIISTPAGDLSGPLEMIAKAPTKMHVSISVDTTPLGVPGQMVIEQVFDGTTGVMSNSLQGTTEPMSGDQLDAARNAYFPSPLLNYKERGFTIALEPQQKVNDRNALVLLVTPKSGKPSRMFFDAETFLLVRAATRIVSPQLGEVDQVSEAADYRTVDGVKVAFTVFQSAGGQNVTMKFTKIENNVPIDDAVFVKK